MCICVRTCHTSNINQTQAIRILIPIHYSSSFHGAFDTSKLSQCVPQRDWKGLKRKRK